MQWFVFAFLFLLEFGLAQSSTSVKVTRVIPEGIDVYSTRQITLTFNQKMVPLGRMERTSKELGIQITPEIECQWRWLDPQVLACELNADKELTKAQKYTIQLAAGLKSISGSKLETPFTHSFSTPIPKLTSMDLNKWKGPGWPSFIASFDQPVTEASVAKIITLKNANKSIPVTIQKVNEDNSYDSYWARAKGEKQYVALYDGDPVKLKSYESIARQSWRIEMNSAQPLSQTLTLGVHGELQSIYGPLPGRADRDLTLNTFDKDFKFLKATCTSEGPKPAEIEIIGPQKTKCASQSSIMLHFTSPPKTDSFIKQLLATPGVKKIVSMYSEEGSEGGSEENYYPSQTNVHYGVHRTGQVYEVEAPVQFMPGKFIQLNIVEAKDVFDRSLANPVKLEFEMGSLKPRLNLPYRVAVLEKNEKTDVPLFITNLDSASFEYKVLTIKGWSEKTQKTVSYPDGPKNIAYKMPMNLRSFSTSESFLAVGKITHGVIHQEFHILVTPFHVHVKKGFFNSLVWVTDMKTGAAVSGAKVEVYKQIQANYMLPGDKTLETATTDTNGVAYLSSIKNISDQETYYYGVRVSKESDFAILPLDYNFNSQYARTDDGHYYWYDQSIRDYIRTWGTTAQGIYRAGETVQFKLYIREENNRKLVAAPKKDFSLVVKDPTGKEIYTVKKMNLDNFGSFAGEFKTPKNATVGWYTFEINKKMQPLRVLISDFTPLSFKVETELNRKILYPNEDLTISTLATMHAGGPYTDARVRVVGLFKYDEFTSSHGEAVGFNFQFNEDRYYESSPVVTKEGQLDSKGQFSVQYKAKDIKHNYGKIIVESAVADDRGKNIAAIASLIYSGTDLRVGLRSPGWAVPKGKPSKVPTIVVDESGTPVSGKSLDVVVQRQVVKSARVKGAGNAYISQYETNWDEIKKCQLKSSSSSVDCTFTPSKSGYYNVIASVKDSKGRLHQSNINFYVYGSDPVVWDETPDMALKIIPEKKDYKIGDKARFLVKNPLPGANALVTIERYGILKSWNLKMNDSIGIIEFDLEDDYVPGFYLSVILTAPRVPESGKKEIAAGDVDLGKPTVRMGVSKVDVKDPYKEIIVNVKTNGDLFRPREKVQLSMNAKIRNESKAKEPIQLAVAVVDESVLALVAGGADNYNPYKGFYKLNALNVENFNLLMRLIGRQKFEKKGANQGGDGGAAGDVLMRNIFKFVSYWNPNIAVDKDGNAKVDFQLPDNLTGWRVLVMAVTPTDRMGLGHVNFKVNKPTEIRPVMPNQVREGDLFTSGFSVMNRTEKPRKLNVNVKVTGDIKDASAVNSQSMDLKPFERKTVWLPLQTTSVKQDRNVINGILKFSVTAKDNVDSDGLEHELPVLKRRSLDTAASYGSTTENKTSENIEFPKEIYTDIGSVSVTASPSVIGNLDGSFLFARNYPYSCWEQKLTKGTLASHFNLLKDYSPGVQWSEAKKLPQETLDLASNYQAPNGGMAYYSATTEFASPYLSAYTALAFQWLKQAGHKVPEQTEDHLHKYLLSELRQQVRAGLDESTRAAILYSLAKAKKINSDEVKRFFPNALNLGLFGKGFLLLAAMETGGTDQDQSELVKKILSQGNQKSGKFLFNDNNGPIGYYNLSSPVRDHCILLTALSRYAHSEEGKKLVSDVPLRLARSILQMRKGLHYATTQENIYCLQAFVDYAKEFEKDIPKMKVTASLNNKKFGTGEFKKFVDPLQTYERSITASDAGTKATAQIERSGTGRLYYSTRVSFALKEEVSQDKNAGIELHREYFLVNKGVATPVQHLVEVKRGDLIKVQLTVAAAAPRFYVVVSDPIPGGFEPVQKQLATTSQVDAEGDTATSEYGYGAFYFQEIKHDFARFYSEYFGGEKTTLVYTMQAIAPGTFSAEPTHAEEMYEPDVYGKAKPVKFSVKE
ncbi:MAG: large extracellular alpha-helical protein [Deltaproteobacteria bacterium]|nr:large extracellular alpha-helical protein [Deltaproteobacteria bacterium]